jgi:hypothetical protein
MVLDRFTIFFCSPASRFGSNASASLTGPKVFTRRTRTARHRSRACRRTVCGGSRGQAARADGAGVVDEYVDGLAVEFRGQRIDLVMLSDIQRVQAQPARMFVGERLEIVGLCRCAAAGQHLPAVGSETAGQAQAQAAVGAGNQHSRHIDSS